MWTMSWPPMWSGQVVSTIDELLDQHMDFLDSCLKECMLTDPLLLKTITKLMSTCTLPIAALVTGPPINNTYI